MTLVELRDLINKHLEDDLKGCENVPVFFSTGSDSGQLELLSVYSSSHTDKNNLPKKIWIDVG